MPAIFGGAKLPVRGWADPEENVTVTFAGQTVSGTAMREGVHSPPSSPQRAGYEA